MKCIGWKLYLINDYVKRQWYRGEPDTEGSEQGIWTETVPRGSTGVSEPGPGTGKKGIRIWIYLLSGKETVNWRNVAKNRDRAIWTRQLYRLGTPRVKRCKWAVTGYRVSELGMSVVLPDAATNGEIGLIRSVLISENDVGIIRCKRGECHSHCTVGITHMSL